MIDGASRSLDGGRNNIPAVRDRRSTVDENEIVGFGLRNDDTGEIPGPVRNSRRIADGKTEAIDPCRNDLGGAVENRRLDRVRYRHDETRAIAAKRCDRDRPAGSLRSAEAGVQNLFCHGEGNDLDRRDHPVGSHRLEGGQRGDRHGLVDTVHGIENTGIERGDSG